MVRLLLRVQGGRRLRRRRPFHVKRHWQGGLLEAGLAVPVSCAMWMHGGTNVRPDRARCLCTVAGRSTAKRARYIHVQLLRLLLRLRLGRLLLEEQELLLLLLLLVTRYGRRGAGPLRRHVARHGRRVRELCVEGV